MSTSFPAFALFDVISFVMLGALVFLLLYSAFSRLQLWIRDRRWRRHWDPELDPAFGDLGLSAGFRLHEPDSALRHLDFHRVPPRTVSWTGSHLVGGPPPREELRIRS